MTTDTVKPGGPAAAGARLRHAIELREHRLHPVVGPPSGAARARDPEGLIVMAFEGTAAFWLAAAGVVALSGVMDWAPRSVTDGRTTVHLAIALAASAAAGLSGMLYAIPRRLGARLWSHALPWAHVILLNVAFIAPAWRWHTTELIRAADWSGLLVTVTGLHLACLAALAVNLGESFAPLMERPRPVVFPEPPPPAARPAGVEPPGGSVARARPAIAAPGGGR